MAGGGAGGSSGGGGGGGGGSFLNRLRNYDAYAKTLDDFSVKTLSGAFISLASYVIIIVLVLSELADYRRSVMKPQLAVDKSRTEKMSVYLNITFPHVPCFMLGLDVMDTSGAHQVDVHTTMFKTRLNQFGNEIAVEEHNDINKGPAGKHHEASPSANKDDANKAVADTSKECGSCYGAVPPASGCCDTCDDVREAYGRSGWAFVNPDGMIQCKREHWLEKLQEQSNEGCNMHGYMKINKIAGNFHILPGQSMDGPAGSNSHSHTFYKYYPKNFDFAHTIHHLSFGPPIPDVSNPLDGAEHPAPDRGVQYQYFLKVVATEIKYLNGQTTHTNQYSVTTHERDIRSDLPGRPLFGLPGIYVMFDISPMLVTYVETRRSLASFLTSLCAIIGGIYTVASILDSFVYNAERSLRRKIELGKAA
ncbi:endoplasmic reticulum-golgi intermediate compartment protein 3-like protein [Ramicandelaber brevisporus]|nr:endoplasmic reticulum-golgi intermediate compartment protein 3-like protein [Ramicandelaber brevisporus]